MKKDKTNHMVDLLFPLALLFVFAVSAIAVLLFATDIYGDSVDNSSRNSSARTSIAYISEKVHQNDEGSRLYKTELDGCEALVLSSTIKNEEYLTYIYVCEGELRELFVGAEYEVHKDMGTKILNVKSMSINEINSRLFRIICIDEDGRQASTIVGIRS